MKVIFFPLYAWDFVGGVEDLLYSFLDLVLNIRRQLQVSAVLSSVFTEHDVGLFLGPV